VGADDCNDWRVHLGVGLECQRAGESHLNEGMCCSRLTRETLNLKSLQ